MALVPNPLPSETWRNPRAVPGPVAMPPASRLPSSGPYPRGGRDHRQVAQKRTGMAVRPDWDPRVRLGTVTAPPPGVPSTFGREGPLSPRRPGHLAGDFVAT